jgi:hypothetical protein
MDPLSVATGCISLLNAVAKTSVSVTAFIRSCREARNDLTSVIRELSDLRLVLELLKDDSNMQNKHLVPETVQTQTLSVIRNCEGVLKMIDALLENCSARLEAVRWAVDGKAPVAHLQQSLEAYREALSLALETVNLYGNRI